MSAGDPGRQRQMSKRTQRLDKVLYPTCNGDWDNNLFRAEILPFAHPATRLLDLGAGSGIVGQMRFRGRVTRVCGLDPDACVLNNPHLDEAAIGRAEQIPYGDDQFDLVIANNVLEHLKAPENAFREIARVLRPGGLFLAKTPNRWHYVPLIAGCTPHWFHEWVNQWRGRKVAHTFPTQYRLNTPRAVTRYAARSGLVVRHVTLFEGRPEYLRMTVPTYLVGWLYERLVNLVPGLSRFRAIMICALEKPRVATGERSIQSDAA